MKDPVEQQKTPPLAPANQVFLVLHDWFNERTLREERDLVEDINRFVRAVKESRPDARTYGFLPLIGLEVNQQEFGEFQKHPMVRWIIRPRYAFDHYAPILEALSAMRSQTGHQMFQFWNLIANGGELPNYEWEGNGRPGIAIPRLRKHNLRASKLMIQFRSR